MSKPSPGCVRPVFSLWTRPCRRNAPCVHVCVRVRVRVRVHVRVRVCGHVHVCVRACVRVCVCVRLLDRQHACPLCVCTPGAYRGTVQTEDVWEEVGTEDLAQNPMAHPVLQLILQRAKEGSMPQRRTDSAKLGLVVEGVGKCWVCTAALWAE